MCYKNRGSLSSAIWTKATVTTMVGKEHRPGEPYFAGRAEDALSHANDDFKMEELFAKLNKRLPSHVEPDTEKELVRYVVKAM